MVYAHALSCVQEVIGSVQEVTGSVQVGCQVQVMWTDKKLYSAHVISTHYSPSYTVSTHDHLLPCEGEITNSSCPLLRMGGPLHSPYLVMSVLY